MPSTKLVRHPNAAATTGLDDFHIITPDEYVVSLEGDCRAFSAFWAYIGVPRSRSDVEQYLSEIDALSLLTMLIDHNVLIESTGDLRPSESELPYERLLLVVCGSFHAHRAPTLCQEIRESVARQVDVILTQASKKFLSPYVFNFYADACFENHDDGNENIKTPHAVLSDRADLVLVWPATARTISKIAHGTSSDLASTALLAHDNPVVVAPSMNPRMWKSMPVQRNIQLLREYGFRVLEPEPVWTIYKDFREPDLGVGGVASVESTVRALSLLCNDLPRRPAAWKT